MIPDRGHGSKRRDGFRRRLTLRLFLSPGGFLERRRFLISSLAASLLALADGSSARSFARSPPIRDYSFNQTFRQIALIIFSPDQSPCRACLPAGGTLMMTFGCSPASVQSSLDEVFVYGAERPV